MPNWQFECSCNFIRQFNRDIQNALNAYLEFIYFLFGSFKALFHFYPIQSYLMD